MFSLFRRKSLFGREHNLSRPRRQLALEALEDRTVPATLTVNSAADPGTLGDTLLTLREAINVVNTQDTAGLSIAELGQIDTSSNPLGTSDTIVFQSGLSSPITLSSGELPITKSVTITGPGADVLTISGNNASRIFNINDSTATNQTVSISGLTLSGGNVSGKGGAILNKEMLTLTNTVLTGNQATGASGQGGAVYQNGGGSVTLTNCTLSGNTSNRRGGAAYIKGVAVTVQNSTISGNTATTGGGGGLALEGSGVKTIIGSTISGNTAQYGAGVYFYDAPAGSSMQNCTVASNTATITSTKTGGGGVLLYTGTLDIKNCTISGNTATNSPGGGIHVQNDLYTGANTTATLNLSNTIVSGNTDSSGPNEISRYNNALVTINADHNLFQTPPTAGVINGTDNANITGDPKLTPLGDFGGTTQTMGLLPGSPAINAGDDNLVPAGLTTDERGAGFTRFNGTVDLGAFEVQQGPATFTVTNTNDSGSGSLRQAILDANTTAGGTDSIVFQAGLTGTITLTSHVELDILDSVTITGPGAGVISVDGAGATRIFEVGSGVTATISGLTIANGFVSGNGGGILNSGTLTLLNSTLSGNTASGAGKVKGGAILNSGALTVQNSTLSGNTVTSNQAYGAGIYNLTGGMVTVQNSTISANNTTGATAAGGTLVNAGTGTMLLQNSTVSGNTATAPSSGGAGIVNVGTLTVQNSTLSGNTAAGGANGAYGGGILNGGTLTLQNSTLSLNTASGAVGTGGGIFNVGTLNLTNTLIAGNTNTAAPDVAGTVNFATSFNNLIGDGTGMSGISTGDGHANQVGTGASPIDPRLGPLQNNGGPTQTMALQTGSPAIGAGSNSVIATLTTDQRGVARQVGSIVDIGAYEYIGSISVISTADGSGTLTSTNGSSTVTDTTLRGAILYVGPGGAITFQSGLSGTITLTGGSLSPTADVTISGAGAAVALVNASGRVFDFTSGELSAVTLKELTITGSANDGEWGGAIRAATPSSSFTLTIDTCTVSGTNSDYGGAIGADTNNVIITGSTITGTNAGTGTQLGGAIFSLDGTTTTIANSTIAGSFTNASFSLGGAVCWASIGTFDLSNSTITGSSATYAGGLFLQGGTATLKNSTISGNTSANNAAGVYFNAGTLNVVNSTISGNTSTGGQGGGLCIYNGTATLSNTIVAGNSDTSGANGATSDLFRNTDVFDPTLNASSSLFSSTPTTGPGSTINGTNTNNHPNTDPLLGPLQDNGGPTHTMALQAGSPAIDLGEDSLAGGLSTDQRGSGFPRILGLRVDIGAFESGGPHTFTVTNLNDSGTGSLRQAIHNSNVVSGSDTIVFQSGLTGTITLTSGELDILDSATITGPGASVITVSGNNASRIFNINDGTAANQAVFISGLTLSGGSVGADGGAIRSVETLAVLDSVLTGNTANRGGAIFQLYGGPVTVQNCVFSGNFAQARGGAIHVEGAAATVQDSTISGNTANTGPGGGIYLGRIGLKTIVGCTISGNTAAYGAGVYLFGTSAGSALQNCTITGNTATINTTSDYDGGGGGVLLYSGLLAIQNCTITGNLAPSTVGGGIRIKNDNAGTVVTTLDLQNTIVAGNSDRLGANDVNRQNNPNVTINADHNLIQAPPTLGVNGTTTNAINGTNSNNITGDPLLRPLADNGGTTQTMAPLPGSPAVDARHDAVLATLTPDHRGLARKSGAHVDIGAYETQTIVVTGLADNGGIFTPGTNVAFATDTTLRGALANAHAGDLITFQSGLTGTTTLTSGELAIATSLTITGPGASVLTISGNNASRIFNIDDGTVANLTVAVSGLTLADGSTNANGGGINVTNEIVTLSGLVIRDCVAVGNGGAVRVQNGSLTILNSTLSDNSAGTGGLGGAVRVGNSAGNFCTIRNSTISGNTAGSAGGGVYSNANTTTIDNCTIAGNTANIDNLAGNSGGGIYLGSHPTTLNNTIVSGNFRGTASPVASDVAGTVQGASANNLIGVDTGLSGISNGSNGNQIGTAAAPIDALLGPLGDYGGQMQTMGLLPGSPAINAGSNALAAGLSTDQRGAGFARIVAGTVDIGAFEVQQGPTTFTVTNLNDSGTGSLRQAILNAATTSGANTVDFQSGLSGTITLTSGELAILSSMTITGPGADVITVSGNNASRIFNIDDGTAAVQTVSISGLTLTKGNPVTGYTSGGAILNLEALTIVNTVFTGNHASGGGAIQCNSGSLTILSSTLSDNAAAFRGGAVDAGVTMTVQNSTISGNTAGTGGGGLFLSGSGIRSITASTISGNTSSYAAGVYINGSSTTIKNCTITGNTATLTDSAPLSNSSRGGGGVLLYSGDLSVENCTLSGNTAAGSSGGGIGVKINYDGTGTATLDLRNTIVSGNRDRTGANDIGRFTATNNSTINASNSLIQTTPSIGIGKTINGTNANNIFGKAPLLGPLQDNGGPTPTMALLPGSPAIDAGSDSVLTAPFNVTTDQRGFARRIGAHVDIGAFEKGRTIVVTSLADGAGVFSGSSTTAANTDTTLRGALANSQNGDTITFQSGLSGTITLTSGQLTITDSVTIAGPGASLLTINGNSASRIFNVDDGSAATDQTVTISGLTLTGGNAGNSQGGAVRNKENLTLANSVLTGNQAQEGGAVYHSAKAGSVTVLNSILSGNIARQGPVGSLNDRGGAIAVIYAPLTIRNSTISGNVSVGPGGGIYLSYTSGVTIVNSTIANNTADYGGGIYDRGDSGGSKAVLQNCTITGNTATFNDTSDNDGGGGGVLLYAGVMDVKNCTITNNTAPGSSGGGIRVKSNGSGSVPTTLNLQNTIVAGNSDRLGANDVNRQNNASVTINADHDLIQSPATVGTSGTTTNAINGTNNLNIFGQDPQLGPLQNNGGLTQTVALGANSPAIDQGNNASAAGLTTDQRGAVPRIFNGTVDIGAYEFGALVLALNAPTQAIAGAKFTITVNVDPAFSGNVALSLTRAPAGGVLTGTTIAPVVNGVATFSNLSLNRTGDYVFFAATGSDLPGVSATVTVVSTTHFSVSTNGVTTKNAGDSVQITIKALDALGQPDSSYAGTVHLSSTDPQAVFPGGADVVLSGGTAMVNVTLKTAGSRTITAVDVTKATAKGVSTAISVKALTTVSAFKVTGYPTTDVTGVAHSFTVTAVDTFGNRVVGYTKKVQFSTTDPDTAGVKLPPDYTFAPADKGAHTFSATLKTLGSWSIIVTEAAPGTATGMQSGINVVSPATHFKVAFTSPTTSVAAGTTVTIKITALDASNHPDLTCTDSVHLSSTDLQAVFPGGADVVLAGGTATVDVTLVTAGSRTITATATARPKVKGTSAAVSVKAGSVATLSLTGYPTTGVSGVAHKFTVTALDAFGNRVGSYRGTVHFTSSDGQAVFPVNNYKFTAADNSAHTFSATLKSLGNQTLTVSDGTLSGSTPFGVYIVSSATRFSVTVSPTSITAGGQVTVTVRALNGAGAIDKLMQDTVHVTSSDSLAIVPADNAITWNQGVATFNVTLPTAAKRTITVTDTTRPNIKATSAAVTVKASNPSSLSAGISGPATGVRGQPLSFTLSATGQAAGASYTYKIDWNGDGIVDQTVSGASGLVVSHVFPAAVTSSTIKVKAVDGAGNVSPQAQAQIVIKVFDSQIDLIVGGTTGNDTITISPTNATGTSVSVSINGVPQAGGPFTPAHILIYGQGGNDVISVVNNQAVNVAVPAILFGDAGNDTLSVTGSSAGNVLVGGKGNDKLTGGAGRTIQIGGAGTDTLNAGSGGDILIGGSTIHDSDALALLALTAEWSRTDRGYLERVNDLFGEGSGGLNGAYLLSPQTVSRDSAIDQLFGSSSGIDWFWWSASSKAASKIKNYASGEVVTFE